MGSAGGSGGNEPTGLGCLLSVKNVRILPNNHEIMEILEMRQNAL